jgi:predicted metalloprotease with PDZ domain
MTRTIFAAGLLISASLSALAQPLYAQPAAASPDVKASIRPAARTPGTMILSVDVRDTARAIMKVKQIIPVSAAGPLVLRLPEWLPGNHAPRGQIEKIAGLVIKAGGKTLPWKRDWQDVFSFAVDVPAGTKALDISFSFLSATDGDQGRIVMTGEMMNIQWHSVSLYPAGWATNKMPISASVTYPDGWRAATALRPAAGGAGAGAEGNTVRYETVDYETLVDSPVFAGKHFSSWPLGNGAVLNVVADEAKYLAAKPEQIEAHKRLVDQALKVFGTRQYDHYDFLLALTDRMGSIGLEHHRSSENGVNPEYFTEWDTGPGRRNLLPHELTHSWNGKHRRPAGQMVPDFATPLNNDLLWVYEGQTQFWGYVLGARSGMFSKQETLDALGSIAAGLDIRRGRDWRSVDDTTYDPIITPRRPKGWVSYQRSEDYYNEGMLIWLEVDAIIRAKSAGQKSIDQFARAFFGTKEGDWSARGYDFDELVRTLNGVVPHDWSAFLKQRLTEKAGGAPMAGLEQGGYRLIYTDTQTPFFKDAEKRSKELNLIYSLGGTIGKGKLTSVVWDGPLFNAGLPIGTEIVAVGGNSYSDDVMKDAITAAKGGKDPIRLIVKNGNRVKEVLVNWTGGLRYPRLEKNISGEGNLDRLLTPQP